MTDQVLFEWAGTHRQLAQRKQGSLRVGVGRKSR